jgi:hypothetical protein
MSDPSHATFDPGSAWKGVVDELFRPLSLLIVSESIVAEFKASLATALQNAYSRGNVEGHNAALLAFPPQHPVYVLKDTGDVHQDIVGVYTTIDKAEEVSGDTVDSGSITEVVINHVPEKPLPSEDQQ